MNNKDLTVEVKPAAKVKPVVLSPRYPNGYGIHFCFLVYHGAVIHT